jgi:Na+:H+ antiporter, NhaA family
MLVGLDVKYAVVEGELSSLSNAALPVIAAVGGMAWPALVYIGCNWDDTEALRGCGIPTATDIALCARRISPAGIPGCRLRIFLLALACRDAAQCG